MRSIEETMAENRDVDLSSLSLEQLKALLPEAKTRIEELEETKRQEAWEKMLAAAADVDMAPAELVKYISKRNKSSAKAKYRNPKNSEQTWTGRGRKPGWIEAWLASGKTLEDLSS